MQRSRARRRDECSSSIPLARRRLHRVPALLANRGTAVSFSRHIRSSTRRRQDAYADPLRRRTRMRSRRLSLRLRERLCSPARTPRCRCSSISTLWRQPAYALGFVGEAEVVDARRMASQALAGATIRLIPGVSAHLVGDEETGFYQVMHGLDYRCCAGSDSMHSPLDLGGGGLRVRRRPAGVRPAAQHLPGGIVPARGGRDAAHGRSRALPAHPVAKGPRSAAHRGGRDVQVVGPKSPLRSSRTACCWMGRRIQDRPAPSAASSRRARPADRRRNCRDHEAGHRPSEA